MARSLAVVMAVLVACAAGGPRVSAKDAASDGVAGDTPGEAVPDGLAPADALGGDEADSTGSVPIGAACTLDTECAPGFCAVTFPGGYCTVACDSTPCPAGAYCSLSSKGRFCYKACSSQADCRDGYACSISSSSQCVPYGAVDVYGTCVHTGECSGGAACLVIFCGASPCAAGTCAVQCASGACPGGGTCDDFDGAKWCVKGCTATSDCPDGQTCQDGNPDRFCSPG